MSQNLTKGVLHNDLSTWQKARPQALVRAYPPLNSNTDGHSFIAQRGACSLDDNALELPFKGHVKERIFRKICENIRSAIADSTDRDALLAEYTQRLEGLASPSSLTKRWRGASNVVDPMTQEAHLTFVAQIYNASKRDPGALVQAPDPDNDRNAEEIESWLTAKGHQVKFNALKYQMAFNEGKWPAAILFNGWETVYTWDRTKVYQNKHGDVLDEIPADANPEDEWEVVHQKILKSEERIGPRVVNTPDFYMYPANCKNLQLATGCGERLRMTEAELIIGIDQYGFDEEVVDQIIATGPNATWTTDEREDDSTDRTQGVQAASGKEGLYEVWLYFTKLPPIRENNKLIYDEDYLYDDFMVYCVPKKDLVLSMDYSPYGHTRPYVKSVMVERPGMFYGWCIPQLLDCYQVEATATRRFLIDSMNISASPTFKVRKSAVKDIEGYAFGPGMLFPLDDPEKDMVAFPQGQAWMQAGGVVAELDNSARNLIGTASSTPPPKVQKAAAVQQQAAAIGQKSDLYQAQFNMFIEDVYYQWISMAADRMTESGEEWVDDNGQSHRITPQMLREKYIIRATGTSQDANPEVRIQKTEARAKIVTDYCMLAASGKLPPILLSAIWESSRRRLLELDSPNPEQELPPKPQPPPPAPPGMVTPMAPPQGAGPPQGQQLPMPGAGPNAQFTPGPAQQMQTQLLNQYRNGTTPQEISGVGLG